MNAKHIIFSDLDHFTADMTVDAKEKMHSDYYCYVMDTIGATCAELEWSKSAWQLFTFRSDGVNLVFYPHKTKSTGHRHIRVRNENSKRPDVANWLMDRIEAGCTCIHFARKK